MFAHAIPLFKLFGFQIKLDWSWFIIAVLIAWSLTRGFPMMYPDAGFTPTALWAMSLIGTLVFFASIVLHELGHAIVAERQGVPMKGITLFIFGGVAEMTSEPPSAKSEFLVAIGGPMVSLALAILFLGTANYIALPIEIGAVVWWLGAVNAALLVFNMIPAFPLDGGRVLRSILWHFQGNLQRATRVSSNVGATFGLALILLGVFSVLGGQFIQGIWFGLIGLFLRGAANSSYQQVMMRGVLEGKPIELFINDRPEVVPPHLSIEQWIEQYVYRYHHKMFPVVDDGRLLGWITIDSIRELPRDKWPWHAVGDHITRPNADNSVTVDADAMEVLKQMSQHNQSRLLVTRDGALAGIITLKDLLQYIDLKRELEAAA
jgi:Zn-dependent protease